MKERPTTTLFMLESLDGKINSGNNDSLDVDKDWIVLDSYKTIIYAYERKRGKK